MAIKRMDEVLAAIAAGKSNAEIRDEIDGRIGDKAINQLRKHPANADVPWPEDARRAEEAMRRAMQTRQEAESKYVAGEFSETAEAAHAQQEPENAAQSAAPQAAAPAAEAEQVPFVPESEETVPEEEPEGEEPQLPECVTAMLEETDPPMSVAEAIRELALYALTDDPDHLIAAALAVKTRMHKLNRRIKR